MSVILDALRKLDREKSSRQNAPTNIAVEILRPDLPRPMKKFPLVIATVSLTAIAAVVVTYVVILKFGFLPKTLLPGQKSLHVSTQPVAPAQPDSSVLLRSFPPEPTNLPALSQQGAPTPPDSGLPSKSSPPASTNLPLASRQVAPAPLEPGFPLKSSPPAPTTPPVPNQQVVPAPPSRESARDARGEIGRVPPKIQIPAESKSSKTAVPPSNGSATALPSLKISAIVWYEEPSKRFAMVNGVIANEGSFVEGVKVEKIYPDRVRFSHNGRPFEIAIK
jgi:general secretion pathway protein B